MANSLITAQWVARKSLILLHAKSNFTGRTNRDYQSMLPGPIQGVVLGQQLTLRLPFRYKARFGNKMDANNSVQRYVALSVANQIGVDVNFTSVERAMQLNNFEEQVLTPAMAQLAATLETVNTATVNQIPKFVGAWNTTATYDQVLLAERFLTEALAPEDDRRTLTVNPQASYEFVRDNKGLFNPESAVSDQWLEGVIAERVAGFEAYRNTKLPTHVVGTFGGTPLVNGANQSVTGVGNAYQSSFTLVTDGWSSGASTLNAGDVISIAGVNDVDPESKLSLGRLKQFVVNATVSDSTGAISVSISPAPISGGAYQNVDSVPADNAAITIFGATATSGVSGVTLKQSTAWYRDSVVFANPSMLDLSPLVKMTAAESFEGYNIRFAQQWDPNNDVLPARLDTISGVVESYPELGVRLIEQPA